MMLKSIARLPISPTLSLAPMRPFFFSTSGSSSAPPPKAFETASINLSDAQSEASSDQKATTKPARSKKKLSHQAQSAIWAGRVIHYILNAKPLTNIHSHSLREQILRLQNPDSLHQFQAEPKEKVMRLFTQGVPLNGHVFNQHRVKSAKQAFLDAQNKNDSFVFCPNLLVTKEVFKIMMKLYSNFLITGGFGISKTVSIILFIQLSNHVNSYLFKAAQPQHRDTMEELFYLKRVQVNPFFFDQDTLDKQLEHPKLELPGYKKYFSSTIPRYWYWSIRPQDQRLQKQLRQTLLFQAPQISQQKKNELRSIKDFYQFVVQLQQLYPPFSSYCMKVVVDQFNSVASLARQWNKKVDQYKSMSQDKINRSEYDQYEKDFKLRAKDNIKLLKNVIYLSNVTPPSYILNSSMSIQRELLDSKKGKQPQKVYFNIQNEHGDFEIEEIRYLQGLKGSFIDFLHNFWFQIERKLKIQNKDNTALEEMKKQFLEEVKDKQANYFSRFLFVREYLTEDKIQQIQKKYEQFKKGEKGDKEQNPFKGIYESFTQENTIKYKQKVRQYFLKDRTNHSLAILYALYDIAVLQSNTDDKDKELTANLNDLTNRLLKNPLEFLSLDIYKEILPFTFTKNKESIKFYWKPEQFTSTIKNILFEIQGKQVFNPHQTKGYRNYCSHRGQFFEHCVIQSLLKGADVTFCTLKNSTLKELRFIIEQDRFTTFQSFNHTYKGNHQHKIVQKTTAQESKNIYKEKNKQSLKKAEKIIEQYNQGKPQSEQLTLKLHDVYDVRTSLIGNNLSGLLDKCNQYPGQFCIATPDHKNKFDSSSECIDFIIARKVQAQYQIFTFDVSISRITTKLQNAKSFFTQVLHWQPEKSNYKIYHIILCHSEAQRPALYDPNERFNILYSPWDLTTFRSSNNRLAVNALQRMKEINNMLNDIEE